MQTEQQVWSAILRRQVQTRKHKRQSQKKVIRNLKNTIFSKFNVTNKVNGESDIRSGAVDVRNMKVYKPAPTEVTIGVTDDISKVSIPAEEQQKQ